MAENAMVGTGESAKRIRFKKIAEQRTNKIIKMLRLLGNCSNKSNYEYSEDEVKKIFQVLEKEMKLAKNKFEDALNDEREFNL